MRPSFVDSFVVEAVKDERLPDVVTGFPGDPVRRLALEFTPSVVIEPYQGQDCLPFDNPTMAEPSGLEGLRLRQLTALHGRSFEIDHPLFTAAWQDEYGHPYASINLKGNNFSNPSILETATASERVIAYGLQESAVIRRVLRASRLLREHGIPTEYLLGMSEPKEFPWPRTDPQTEYTERLPLPEYKRRLVENHWLSLEPAERTAEALVELSAKFERMTFFVTMRAMDSSLRLGDVMVNPPARQRVFRYINEQTEYGRQQPLDVNSFADGKRYIGEFLAPRLAKNIARLHGLGLAHRYPNQQNVTALGSLVDLDSVHGETLELGDAAITTHDMANDVVELLWALDAATFGETRYMRSIEDARFSNDPLTTLLAKYAEAIQAETGRVDGLPGPIDIFTEAHHILQDAEVDRDIFSSSPGMLQIKLEKVIVQLLSAERRAELLAEITSWYDSELPNLQRIFENKLRDSVPAYLRSIFDEFVNEIREPQFSAVDAFYRHESAIHREIASRMMDDLAEVVQAAFEEFGREGGQERTDAENFGHSRLRSLYLNHLLLNTDESSSIWNSLGQAVDKILPGLRETFEGHAKLTWPARIFPAAEAYPLLRSAQDVYIMETEGIPLTGVAEYLAASQEDLSIEPMLEPEDIWHNNYVVTDDGSILTELISDCGSNGLSQDISDDEVNRNLRYDMPKGQYYLFVERKPDNTRRLRLHLKDTGLAAALRNASREDVVHGLRNHYSLPGHLFDPADYARGFSNHTVLRERLDNLR